MTAQVVEFTPQEMEPEINEVKETQENPAKQNLNTILLYVALAMLLFIGNETVNDGKAIAKMEASQITRTEYEATSRSTDIKIEDIRRQYADVMTRLAILESEGKKAK